MKEGDIVAYHKPPQIRETQETGTNTRVVRNALASWNLPRIDTKDTAEIEQRIKEYLTYCVDQDICPSVTGCANWLGVSVRMVEYWYRGERGTAEHQRIITKCYNVLQDVWAQDMKEGNINPVSGIFIGKVFYGYKDTQEIVINPKQTEEVSTKDLIEEAKLLPYHGDTDI